MPQYAFDVVGVEVEIDLCTLRSTNTGVVEDIGVPEAYVIVLVPNT